VVSHRCARFGIASSFEATRQTVSTFMFVASSQQETDRFG
jgi:hypothetical protein